MILYRAFATVGGLTLVSRFLGFIRDILIAAALGSGAVADAFFVAFKFPNLFRRLFGEGAFNSAFVPLFAKRLESEGEQKARDFAETAMSGLSFILIIFSAVCILSMPWLMSLLAPGFISDPEKYKLAVLLTQIAFPYLFCMSIVALISGVLNSMHRYWAAAAAPILLNLILITAISIAIGLGYSGEPNAGIILATGVLVAGFAQLAMLWFSLKRAGIPLRLRRPRYDDSMKRLVELGIPGILAGGITQINIVVGTIIASLQAGAVSYLYYADRLYQLPLGLVGVAIGVVLLPELSRRLRAGDHSAAMETQNRSLEFAFLLTLPAAIALAVLAQPIIQVLFERGAFGPDDTHATAQALAAFAIGLPGFVLIKVFQPAFFAREDTKTPMYFAGINMLVNVIGSLALFFLFQSWGYHPHVGIALATSCAGWLNAILLWRKLASQNNYATDRKLMKNLPLITISAVIMGGVLWWLGGPMSPYLAREQSLFIQVTALAGLVTAGMVTFFALTTVTGVFDLSQLRKQTSR